MSTTFPFPGHKVWPEVCSWPLHPHLMLGQEWVGAMLSLPPSTYTACNRTASLYWSCVLLSNSLLCTSSNQMESCKFRVECAYCWLNRSYHRTIIYFRREKYFLASSENFHFCRFATSPLHWCRWNPCAMNTGGTNLVIFLVRMVHKNVTSLGTVKKVLL